MDKLDHFLKKNHHRAVYYFTNRREHLQYVMVLSIHDGTIFMLDLKDGEIPYVETGQIQRRFYVESTERQEFPENFREQPAEDLIRDKRLFRDAIKILTQNQTDLNILFIGPGYILDVARDGGFTIIELTDFPDSLNQHGLFQKCDLEYFYNHKYTIAKTIQDRYTWIYQNFVKNMENIQQEWEMFSRDPGRHLQGIYTLLAQYNERTKQYNELKNLISKLYTTWKQVSAEYDILEVQPDPVSFDQNLKQNHKKQELYRKLDRLKLIEKHATDLLVKIHIAHSCLMLYIHILMCEMSTIRFRADRTAELQEKIQKFVAGQPQSVITALL